MKTKHVILILLCCFVLYLAYLSSKSKFVNNLLSFKRTYFLILGIDSVNYTVHSDTILLMSYSPKNRILDIISIPRDSYINIPEIKFRKLTDIYAYFYTKEKNKLTAAKCLSQVMQNNIFSSQTGKIEIHYFVIVDYQAFKKLVDIIGKIKVYVEEPMHYDDHAGQLHIHFEPGEYFMNGKQLLEYVRYRSKSGDIPRTIRQQQVIKEIFVKMFTFTNILKMPLIIKEFSNCVDTNINLWEIFNILLEFRKLSVNNLRFSYLQGKPQGAFWIIDQNFVNSLIEYFTHNKPTKPYLPTASRLIKVYNATNIPKLALRVSMYLRSKGYDILDWTNCDKKLYKSKIVDYCGDTEFVQGLANILNIHNIFCLYNYREEPEVDVKIFLGYDFCLPQNTYFEFVK